ncbi:MAG: endonuclease MutS2 [Bacteroidia bacterium]|nr:endonuclease MutS2 [Bacteroidia bacterium]MDW8348261.1 endonuclease MutS2 [Bacteroidia bacterium]
MQILTENVIEKLGYHTILERVLQHAICQHTKNIIHNLTPQANILWITTQLKQTEEMIQVLQFEDNLDLNHIYDVDFLLQQLHIQNSFLLPEEYHKILLSLRNIERLYRYFEQRKEKYPSLFELAHGVKVPKTVINSIQNIVDNNGNLKDDASPELKRIRIQIHELQHKLRKKLENILRNAIKEGWVDDQAQLAVRNGKMVLPIYAEHKRKIKGFIQDESATGQTIYIEPEESLEIQGDIRLLENAEKREITKILTRLADEIRPHLNQLKHNYTFQYNIDFIRAKAIFGIQIKGICPKITSERIFYLENARNPILVLNKLDKKQDLSEVIPVTASLDPTQRIILISGPNAGGKSVAMKTFGLLALMIQAGLPVPTGQNSQVCVFHKFMADIGDEQSLETDLSTYSAHLTNMKLFLDKGDERTLFLIDEFGSGTDPKLGGPIAEALLHYFLQQGMYGVITTHYSNLKSYAQQAEGITNAAMIFDTQTMKPTYQLKIGLPGSSFALEIAQRIGLPAYIIEYAKSSVGEQQTQIEHLLQIITQERNSLTQQTHILQQKNKELENLLKKYQQEQEKLEKEKRQIIRQAEETAAKLIKEANKKIEETIRTIKENNADKEITKQVRQTLKQEGLVLEEKSKKEREAEEALIIAENQDIQKGDYVKVRATQAVGEVVEVQKKKVLVNVSGISMLLNLKDVQKVIHSPPKTQRQSNNIAQTLKDKMSSISMQLDIRGQRTEPAKQLIEKFIDDAILTGLREVRILHGKGNGILKQVTRDLLKNYKQIESYSDAPEEAGGGGITIVVFKQ